MNELAGLMRNSSAAATSSASPTRLSACMASDALRAAGLDVMRAASGVLVSPGATQLTRMFLGAYVAAALSARPAGTVQTGEVSGQQSGLQLVQCSGLN